MGNDDNLEPIDRGPELRCKRANELDGPYLAALSENRRLRALLTKAVSWAEASGECPVHMDCSVQVCAVCGSDGGDRDRYGYGHHDGRWCAEAQAELEGPK